MAVGMAPEIWTRQEFAFSSEMIDEQSGAIGVPQDMVPAIASAVLDTLVDLDINPHNVYLSGHDGLQEDPDAAKLQQYGKQRELELVIEDEAFAYSNALATDDLDEDHAEQTELNVRGEREAHDYAVLGALDPEKPVYAMSSTLTLHDPVEEQTNPIHYASITPHSTIVVYDKTLIDRWDPDVPGEIFDKVVLIAATEAELAVTVLARIRLRYRIEDEEYLAPPPPPNN